MKYLFLSNPAVGHTNSLISIALELKRIGEDVLFMLPGVNNEFIRKRINRAEIHIQDNLSDKKINFEIIPISLIQVYNGLVLEKKTGKEEWLHALKVFSSGAKRYFNFISHSIERYKPDAIIYDYTFFPAIAISEKFNIPRIAIYPTGLPFCEYPIPEFGKFQNYNNFTFEEYNQSVSIIKKTEELIKKKYEKIINKNIDICFISKPNSKYLNIITSIEEAEYPRKDLDNTVFFVGPCLKGMDAKDEIKKNKKLLIYISLGTFFNNRPELFEVMINACKNFEADIIVSAGKSYKMVQKKYMQNNIKIYERVSQINILKKADIFLTHGGKNSINESLKFGVPMILFPIGGEQEYNAKLIEYLKCGKMIVNVDENKISEAVNEVFNKNFYSENARKLSKKMTNSDGSENAVKIIRKKSP